MFILKAYCIISLWYFTMVIHLFSVKEFDTNFTYEQQSEFYLQPNATYVFQVRCQETGKRYWQPWSSPFFHKTPEIGECISIFNLFGFSFDFCLSSKFISFFLPDFYQNWQNYSRASQLSSVAQSCPTLCNPHGLQHARLPCPSPKPTRAGDNI